ncbi:L,D-transpeptidase family protein [Aliiglaciecola sp. CAU 1673]|uniref:L,D-transpeptidase family protein n=1 Tax=Aliiglaciecola sp. CAU 1673 TaxID=3032595 RepID=UPI0023DCDE50|nr:L,D-transpeptidase family protein [Aliiglaciecola sp. CAU 1673]MDF2180210.1 L,D-transpeptidase family protein [Aliiglaciecola sp. CAU 1673]
MSKFLIKQFAGTLAAVSFVLSKTVIAGLYQLPTPDTDIVGEVYKVVVQDSETLVDIAQRNGLGFNEILAANPGVDPWLPRKGSEIVIPARFILPPGERKGVVINKAEYRLYYFPEGKAEVVTFPIGIGKQGWDTPTGVTSITAKRENPTWTPPQSVRADRLSRGQTLPAVVPPGPDNPLGKFALNLAMSGYLIHGTNKNFGVGTKISAGCIRLYPEDIAQMYNMLPVGTPVRIIDAPAKSGWLGDELLLEVHSFNEQVGQGESNLTPIVSAIVDAKKDRELVIDWDKALALGKTSHGMPVTIARPAMPNLRIIGPTR